MMFSQRNRMFHAIVMYIFMLVAVFLVFICAPLEKMQGIVQKIFYFHVSSVRKARHVPNEGALGHNRLTSYRLESYIAHNPRD